MAVIDWKYIGNSTLQNPVTNEKKCFSSLLGSTWLFKFRDITNLDVTVGESVILPLLESGKSEEVVVENCPATFDTGIVNTTWCSKAIKFYVPSGPYYIWCMGSNDTQPVEDPMMSIEVIDDGLRLGWGIGRMTTGAWASLRMASSNKKWFIEASYPISTTSPNAQIISGTLNTNYIVYDSDKKLSTLVNALHIPEEDSYGVIETQGVDTVLKFLSRYFYYYSGGTSENGKPVLPFVFTVYDSLGTPQTISMSSTITSITVTANDLEATISGIGDYDIISPVTKDGYTFKGYSYFENSVYVDIPLGTTTVNWDSNITLYPVYRQTNPIYSPTFDRGTIQVMLYKNTAEHNRLNKSSYLEKVGDLYGSLREDTSVTNPILTITYTEYPAFNYVYIYIFKRYYYVDDIVSVRNNVWEIHLSVDVLMTYNAAIRACTAYIDRNENSYNNRIVDNRLPMEQSNSVTYSFKSNGTTAGTPFITTQGQFVLQGLLVSPILASEIQSLSDGNSPAVNDIHDEDTQIEEQDGDTDG